MARVQAEVIAEGRTDRAIEQVVVGRLSLKPSVAEALWRIAEADDD
jgi:virulence factor MgtC-like protein